VFTIARVAAMLGEDEGWLWDVAVEMDPEDGCVFVYGVGDEGLMAFTVTAASEPPGIRVDGRLA